MAKGRRRCKRCGKFGYPTQMVALTAAIRASEYGKSWRAYYDNRCEKWHLTTKPHHDSKPREKET
jgi:hypothetical protein